LIQFRRFAALIVGVWLAGSGAIDTAAISNFHAVDRFLAEPGAPSAELIHSLGHDHTRILLRRAAGESNAWLFEQWEWVQLGVGLALVLVLVFGERPPKLLIMLALVMTAIVLVDRFALSPTIAKLGRLIDFLPADPNLPDRKTFGVFHGIYSSLELVKLFLGFAMAFILIVRRKPDPQMFAREGELAEDAVPPRRPVR
jgi:hypothetical protein